MKDSADIAEFYKQTLPYLQKIKPGKRFTTFAVCVLLASILWLFNAFSSKYTTFIQIPVGFKNLPENYILMNKPPSILSAKVEGFGFDLLPVASGILTDSVIFDLAEVNGVINLHHLQISLGTNELVDQINKTLPNQIKLADVLADSISMEFERNKTKIVPIYPVIQYTVGPQFKVSEPFVSDPVRVRITGPESIINDIKSITNELIDVGEVKTERNVKVKLKSPSKYVKLEPEEAIVPVKLIRYTEIVYELDLMVRNVPEGAEIKTFPATIKVYGLVALDQFETAKLQPPKAYVEFDSLNVNKRSKLKVIIEEANSNVAVQLVEPEKVDFLIVK